MTATARRSLDARDPDIAVRRKLTSVNSVFGLSLILSHATSPAHVMRLVTTAVPSIVQGRAATAWHPSKSGDYFEKAPAAIAPALAGLVEPGQLDAGDHRSLWAFPLTSPLERPVVALVIEGVEPLSDEETFLLAVLAQLCGAAIAKLEMIAAEQASIVKISALNTQLESTVSTLRRTMEIHRRLTEMVPSGEDGIAQTLHELTGLPVLIQDAEGRLRASAGDTGPTPPRPEPRDQREQVIRRLRSERGAVYQDSSWMVLACPRADVVGAIALVDPERVATELDRAALEHAGTVLSVELGRLQGLAEVQLRGDAARERDIADERAKVLAASEARHRAILEAALDGVVSIDSRTRITYVNSAFERIFGYRHGEVMGRELAEVVVPPQQREAHRRGVARYLATGRATILDRRIEIKAMRSDGSEFPAELTVTRTGPGGAAHFTAFIRDVTERQRAEQEIRESRARLVTASDAARQQVTRDLHDGAQQRLVTTLINLQLAEQRWESDAGQAKELLERAIADARHGLEDLRELAAGIHPAALTEHGLGAALEGLATRLTVPVQIAVPGARLPAVIEASIYFFCSEALTNVVKHARARSAWVRVDLFGPYCAVEVGDDGVGGADARTRGGGLTGLRDRVRAIGGRVDVTSPPAGGTVLRATIPLSPGQTDEDARSDGRPVNRSKGEDSSD